MRLHKQCVFLLSRRFEPIFFISKVRFIRRILAVLMTSFFQIAILSITTRTGSAMAGTYGRIHFCWASSNFGCNRHFRKNSWRHMTWTGDVIRLLWRHGSVTWPDPGNFFTKNCASIRAAPTYLLLQGRTNRGSLIAFYLIVKCVKCILCGFDHMWLTYFTYYFV